MEQGDLATWAQPRMIFILEGVLADVRADVSGRFRKKITLSFHWLELPIKRLVYLKNNWPDTSLEVVTFVNQEAADEASRFFDEAQVPVSSVSYRPFNKWVQEIKWQPDIQTIYDSDVPRSVLYGQRGYVVQKGQDFG